MIWRRLKTLWKLSALDPDSPKNSKLKQTLQNLVSDRRAKIVETTNLFDQL